MIYEFSIETYFIPSLSGVLRALFCRRHFRVQFIRMAFGILSCGAYFLKNRHAWDWRRHGPILFVVSILLAPYLWLTDEVVLLPAILQALVWIYSSRKRMNVASLFVVGLFGSLNGLLLLILNAKIPLGSGMYSWSSLVWFGWYSHALTQKKTW